MRGAGLMLTDGQEHPPLIEIDGEDRLSALTYSANGEYLVGGGKDGVRVWRVEDGTRVAAMATVGSVVSLAVSKDGRWIAAGTDSGDVSVWNGETYEDSFSHRKNYVVCGVDFSPNSTRLVTASHDRTAIVWDAATGRRLLRPLRHESWVIAAKYSPQGDRLATATLHSVRVYDNNNGCLLVDVKIKVTPFFNTGLLWSNDQLFIVSDGKIKRIEPSTGSAVLEWPVPDSDYLSCIVLPMRKDFIAYSAKRTVSFWDTPTHTQFNLLRHAQDIRSIALSPDDRFLAIGEEDGKITIKNVSRITESIPLSCLHPTFQEPEIHVDDVVIESWNNDRLEYAEVLLTRAIADARNPNQYVFASRALVRARLGRWDAAIGDAKKSIKIQSSVIGYIAKSVALVGKGKRREGYRACDIAFEHYHSTHVTFLLLIKAIIVFMAGERDDAISRLDDLIATVPSNSVCYVVQAYMYLVLGNSRMKSRNYEDAIQLFERARTQMRRHESRQLLVISLISGWRFNNLGITIRQRLCEALFSAGRAREGSESLLDMINTFDGVVYMRDHITKWVSDFTHRCLSTPETSGDTASIAGQRDEATMLRANLDSTTPAPLLREWAKSTLASGEWKDALIAADSFTVPRFTIYRAICEHLESINRITDASECFRQTVDEFAEQTHAHHKQAEWVLGKLEDLGDTAMGARRHDDAISHYTAILSLTPAAPQGFFIKRSKAYLAKDLWEDALNDANKVIMLDPSSPWGYERKHAALHKAGDYENAIDAFEAMLSKMSQSPDPVIREHHCRYINPRETKAAIRSAVQDTIRESPRVLINTISGRLLDKSQQAATFESLTVFKELVSSMTTRIDHVRIAHDVTQYYRYAMFSHKWEDNEPLFENFVRIVVYDLGDSPTHDKVQMFCRIVRDAGMHWAWSDTCCINKADHVVLQEALVAMFKWYQGSAVTIVFLRGVRSPWRRGDLVNSIWNTRAWTFQEYHASKAVQFYTEDWTPYMNLDVFNHKESPEIISEMEEATGISPRALRALRPGLYDIREKLCLASGRQTTLVEDAAYSLLGIFSVSMLIVYGDGDQALGKLLAQLLTSSGDTNILAWTGRSGSFNSCLPANIKVFSQLPTTHIPLAIDGAKMDVSTAGLRASLNLALVMKFYDRLNELPVPSFLGQRMKLPCLTFKLGRVSSFGPVFRARTNSLGIVEIRTTEDLSRLDSLILVHPWIDFLLNRHPVGSSIAEMIPEENSNDQPSLLGDSPLLPSPTSTNIASATKPSRVLCFVARLGRPFGARLATPRDAASLLSPLPVSLVDKQTQALGLIARLRHPFGALLFTPTRQNVAEYRRVAAESIITVQVEEITPVILTNLVEGVRMLDVL